MKTILIALALAASTVPAFSLFGDDFEARRVALRLELADRRLCMDLAQLSAPLPAQQEA